MGRKSTSAAPGRRLELLESRDVWVRVHICKHLSVLILKDFSWDQDDHFRHFLIQE